MKDKTIVVNDKFLNEQYTLVHHKSGLDIYIFPKKLATTYALFATKYGSIYSKFRLSPNVDYITVPEGIAHFLEHKMFENESGKDTFELYAETGADANAYTGFETTAYLFSCTENFEKSLEILLDTVTHPYFTEETVSKEQGIIAQEIRMGEDNPGRALLFGMLASMYEKSGVRIDMAGTVESISHITPELLYNCYNTFYNLRNMALCVCGDIDVDTVLSIADRILHEAPAFTTETVVPTENPNVLSERFEREMQVSQPLFAIGVKDTDIPFEPSERALKYACMSIIADMLFGPSETFYNDLYDSHIISGPLDSWISHSHNFSFISISGEASDPEKFFAEFDKYVADRKKNALDHEAFERCRRVLFARLVKSFDSTDGIANNFLEFIFDGYDIFDFIRAVTNVTYEYACNLFNSLFTPGHYTYSKIMPISEEDKND